MPRGTDGYADTSNVAKGAYVLRDAPDGAPDVILIGTGSEVQFAVAAQDMLAAEGTKARVVSMPCREWFDEQDQNYRDSVIPPDVTARVSVEAAVSIGWRDLVGDAGRIISIDHFGASAATGRCSPSSASAARPSSPRPGRASRQPPSPARRRPRPTRPPADPRRPRTWKTIPASPSAEPLIPLKTERRLIPMSERLQALSDAGVSIWLDDLSRERITTGNLADLVTSSNVVGVTTNPTIFAGAHVQGQRVRRPDP